MSVQIIIQGDHATDAIAELQNFTAALSSPTTEAPKDVTPEPETTAEEKPKKPRRKRKTKAEKEAEEATKAAEAAPAAEPDLDAMFEDNEAKPDVKEITREDVRDIMGTVGKDEDGNGIQDNLIAIREILTGVVPKGEDVAVKNIPDDKLAEVHAAIKAVGEK